MDRKKSVFPASIFEQVIIVLAFIYIPVVFIFHAEISWSIKNMMLFLLLSVFIGASAYIFYQKGRKWFALEILFFYGWMNMYFSVLCFFVWFGELLIPLETSVIPEGIKLTLIFLSPFVGYYMAVFAQIWQSRLIREDLISSN